MAALLPDASNYHRPSNKKIIDQLVARLAAAPKPPTAKDFRFPMSSKSAAVVCAALNALDTSGQTPFVLKDLRDPWTRATAEKLKRVNF